MRAAVGRALAFALHLAGAGCDLVAGVAAVLAVVAQPAPVDFFLLPVSIFLVAPLLLLCALLLLLLLRGLLLSASFLLLRFSLPLLALILLSISILIGALVSVLVSLLVLRWLRRHGLSIPLLLRFVFILMIWLLCVS